MISALKTQIEQGEHLVQSLLQRLTKVELAIKSTEDTASTDGSHRIPLLESTSLDTTLHTSPCNISSDEEHESTILLNLQDAYSKPNTESNTFTINRHISEEVSDETLQRLTITQTNEEVSDETLKGLNITNQLLACKHQVYASKSKDEDSDMYTDVESEPPSEKLTINMHKARRTKVTTYICPNTNVPTRQVKYHSPQVSKTQDDDDGNGRYQIPKAHQKRMKQRQRRESQLAFIQSLKGFKTERKWVLYLKNIHKPEDMSEEDLLQLIATFCKSKGINILNSQIIYNRFSEESVGCKIVVLKSQARKAKEEVVWPAHIECRDWKKATSHKPFHGKKVWERTDEDYTW